ncbi:hypothetical protein RND81_14G248900 [Saponaria officinalis]|uniref:Uncharacterized protein n=1 Tax=Saponaria officinalis TaxID=3572 RepID=A0AAW1GTE4_SAPOF
MTSRRSFRTIKGGRAKCKSSEAITTFRTSNGGKLIGHARPRHVARLSNRATSHNRGRPNDKTLFLEIRLTITPLGVPVLSSGNISNIRCDIPELRGDKYKVWKERVLLNLGWMDIDYAIRKDEPASITEASTHDAINLYDKWERSNRLSVMFIKTKICASIRGSLKQYTKVKNLLKVIDEQFFSSMRHTDTKGVRDYILRLRNIVAQLKTLEVTISDTFLVNFILCTLPPQYAPFKISYNTHKDKWSINVLMTMCVQEEGRLLMEEGVKKKNDHYKGKGKGKIPAEPTIKKEPKCHFYKKKGHIQKDWPDFKAWLVKKGYDKPKEISGK